MSDDEDYMSDTFLLKTEKNAPSSLIFNKSEQRKFELLKRKAAVEERIQKKSFKVIEQKKREEGLSSAISSTNKGFEMLLKMGYKPGQGLGRTGSGRAEPISIDVKTNRLGVGKPNTRKSTTKINPIAKLETLKTNDFRSRISTKKLEQMTTVDLLRSQKICEQLDAKQNLKEARETWFWPEIKQLNGKDDDDDDDDDDEEGKQKEEDEEQKLSVNEKLETLTKYLRETYYYCIWCGMTYDSNEDLKDNCPGTTRNDH